MVIKNGIIVTPFEILSSKCIIVNSGIITGILEQGCNISDGEEVVDAEGHYVFPGFIDIHTHGGGGSDFMDANEKAFNDILSFHSSNGTTSLLASTVSAPVEQIRKTLDIIRKFIHGVKKGTVSNCRLIGAHIEGPFISHKNKGAHLEKYLLTPENNSYKFITDNSDIIINVTISPELPGSVQMIKELVSKGIIISGGHDDAVDYEIKRAIDAGMTHATHAFCAMSTITKRNGKRHVGLTEISLIDDRITVELIADNHHLTPELVKLAYRCKGPLNACIVSDCLSAGGMPSDGTVFKLGTNNGDNLQEIVIIDDVAVLADGSCYAGSVQPLSRMVRNLVLDCNIPLADAVCMASYTPAKIIRMDHLIGSISPGKSADFCIMDKEFNVVKTIMQGHIVYDRHNI